MAALSSPRLSTVLLWCVLAACIGSTPATACRCKQPTLEEAFRAADEVFVGRLEQATEEADRLRLTFAGDARRYKSVTDPPLTYVTARSSAACGIGADVGAAYVVFAHREEGGDVAWLTSCDGTRVLITRDGQARGFDDVPLRFVPARLEALAGIWVLEKVVEHESHPDDPTSEGLVGLLQIQRLSEGRTIALRAEPTAASSTVASVDTLRSLVRRELGYEYEAAVVFAAIDGWFKLQLVEGNFGWIMAEDGETYHPLAELPLRRLAYLNEHWSGLLWPQLGAGLPFRGSRDGQGRERRRETPVRVLESQRIGGSLWFRIEVLSSDGCDGEETRVAAGGWVPAYGISGEPAVWFYSRGC